MLAYGVEDTRNQREHSGTCLERQTEEGNSPVGEMRTERSGSRVPPDTCYPVGSRGDHPPRLNTTQ